ARNSGPDIDSFPSYSNQVKRTNQPVKQYLSKLAFYLIKTFRKECGPLNKTGIPRNPKLTKCHNCLIAAIYSLPVIRRLQFIPIRIKQMIQQILSILQIKLQRSNQITVNMRTNFILRKTFSGKQY
ncbi:unnamed protein product, partial [Wuchereria bancrofti]